MPLHPQVNVIFMVCKLRQIQREGEKRNYSIIKKKFEYELVSAQLLLHQTYIFSHKNSLMAKFQNPPPSILTPPTALQTNFTA